LERKKGVILDIGSFDFDEYYNLGLIKKARNGNLKRKINKIIVKNKIKFGIGKIERRAIFRLKYFKVYKFSKHYK
jgi:hypothetical protein